MMQEVIAQVGGISLNRVAEDERRYFLVEEPSRGRVAWMFDLENEGQAWAKFDERALHRWSLILY